MSKITFSKDLRKMNKDEFRRIFEYLKEKTSNFTKFYPELILENNQYLLVIRICLGLSQKRFANKLGTTKDWCRHLESRKHKIINIGVAKRYHKKIEKLLEGNEISFENALKFLDSYKFFSYQDFNPIKIKLPSISRMTENDLRKYFNLAVKITENFKKFDSKILLHSPQSILAFRIILGTDHRTFARMVGLNDKTIRNYESGRAKIKHRTAEFVIGKIKSFFEEKYPNGNVGFDKVLEHYRILKGFFGHRNFESMVNTGLYRLAKLKRNSFENNVSQLLKENKICFEIFSVVSGAKKCYNVDFVIPNSENPKIIVESFDFTVGGKSRNIKSKVINVDHRFQSIKLKNPQVKTVMAIRLKGRPILMSFLKKSLDIETLNTDYMIINDELKNLPEFIFNSLNHSF